MRGIAHTAMEVGDSCFIYIESDETTIPNGFWKAEVTETEDAGGFQRIAVGITDGRVKDHSEEAIRLLFGHEPRSDYLVYPDKADFIRLITAIRQLRSELIQQARTHEIREGALLDAMERVTRRGLSADEARAAVLDR